MAKSSRPLGPGHPPLRRAYLLKLAGLFLAGGDPGTMRFIDQRIALVPDAGVPRGGVKVTLTTRDDVTVDIGVRHALGTPQCPATRAQVEDKFLRYAAPRLGRPRSKELLAELAGLDQVGDCANLIRRSRP